MTALHSRAVSAVTAASCVVHLWLVAGNHHGPWLNVVMLAMVGVCLPCAVHLWRGGREKALRQVMGCALAMTALHAMLLLGAPAFSGSGAFGNGLSGHAHAAAAAAPGGGFFGTGSLGSGAEGLLAVVVLEITTAFLAATLLARLRAVPGLRPPRCRERGQRQESGQVRAVFHAEMEP